MRIIALLLSAVGNTIVKSPLTLTLSEPKSSTITAGLVPLVGVELYSRAPRAVI
jgi:hypothetical protein